MQKSSLIIAGLICILATVWILSGLFSNETSSLNQNKVLAEKIGNKPIQSVLVQPFVAQSFVHYLVVNGRSLASRTVTLKAEISAQVEEIIRQKGSIVLAGDPLIALKKDDRQIRVKEAEYRVRQKEIEYNAALKLKTEGLNSTVRVAETRAELESARAELERAELNLKNTQIVAPFDGVVDRQYIEIGDFLDIGQDIVKIVDLDPIKFKVFVSERDIQPIKLGKTVLITLMDKTELEGVVSYISVSAEEKTRTFPVEISLANKDLKIKEGMTVELSIPLPSKKAHKIPSSSLVLNDQGDIGVRSLDLENKVQFHPIEILSSREGYNWVLGLQDEISLIIQGQDFVEDGQEVVPTILELDMSTQRTDIQKDMLP